MKESKQQFVLLQPSSFHQSSALRARLPVSSDTDPFNKYSIQRDSWSIFGIPKVLANQLSLHYSRYEVSVVAAQLNIDSIIKALWFPFRDSCMIRASNWCHNTAVPWDDWENSDQAPTAFIFDRSYYTGFLWFAKIPEANGGVLGSLQTTYVRVDMTFRYRTSKYKELLTFSFSGFLCLLMDITNDLWIEHCNI